MPSVPAVNSQNRFDDFFKDPLYLELKNYLYNYQIRKERICRELSKLAPGLILEIGAGVSPITPQTRHVVYTDLSETAAEEIQRKHDAEKVIAMSATDLCFKSEVATAVVCSEVLEHVANDRKALGEIYRVLKPNGSLFLTLPVHSYWYTVDDVFVKHLRRYDPKALTKTLEGLGFTEIRLIKLTGLLDKLAMILAVLFFKFFSVFKFCRSSNQKKNPGLRTFLVAAYRVLNRAYGFLVRLEASIIPFGWATIVLFQCKKGNKCL